MDTVPVVIVGAGPSGLTLGLALAKYGIRSLILEKDPTITDDPRGVHLSGDAMRYLHDLGLRDQWKDIGVEPGMINFHRTSFQNAPFFTLDASEDALNHFLPTGMFHLQPKLETALSELVDESAYCTLRRGCEVRDHQIRDDDMSISFKNESGDNECIQCNWLVGADGKKGVVRKRFLEPETGIKQGDGVYIYDGTWVAANLQIRLPTPATHPHLPFWTMGMPPQQVYELFWPRGWHFCTPPSKATACGRFGPSKERYWRHEFAEPHWDESMNSEQLLWEHITPMITRDRDEDGRRFPGGPITYPRDCIDVKRCRPFTFTHKVVNRWFDRRRILIGDAAHVFPPFGGEGIASGIRDAMQLAWRLALVEKTPELQADATERLLAVWALERKASVDSAALTTKFNGTLCNEPESWGFYVFRQIRWLYQMLPFLPPFPDPPDRRALAEVKGFKGTGGGFFLSEFNGGAKVAQVVIEHSDGATYLSDHVLQHKQAMFTILVVSNGGSSASDAAEAKNAVRTVQLPPSVLNENSVVVFHVENPNSSHLTTDGPASFQAVTPGKDSGLTVRKGYHESAYLQRLGPSTKFAIVRPDFYIFAVLENAADLQRALAKLKRMLLDENAARL